MNIKENILPSKNGFAHGYHVRYWGNGNLMYKGNYVNGKQHGYWECYYSNGNLMYKGNYLMGKRYGHWVEHNSYINQYITKFNAQ